MENESKTTKDLRQALFDTIEGVTKGTIETKDALAISKLADNIIKTADLELRHAQVISTLDKDDQGITPGPLLLTD